MGRGVGSDLHNLIGGSKSVADWWEHSPPINVTILLGTAVGTGVGSHLHNLISCSKSGADWWENSPTINVAIRLKRAVGRVVRGYLLNQIRGSKSGAVVQALSSHQCIHPTGKSSREGGWWWGAICIIRSGWGARAAKWYRYLLPSMWPGFRFQRRRHILVEFVVASLPCSEKIFLRLLRFSPLLKNQQWQTLIRFGTHGHVQTSS